MLWSTYIYTVDKYYEITFYLCLYASHAAIVAGKQGTA